MHPIKYFMQLESSQTYIHETYTHNPRNYIIVTVLHYYQQNDRTTPHHQIIVYYYCAETHRTGFLTIESSTK